MFRLLSVALLFGSTKADDYLFQGIGQFSVDAIIRDESVFVGSKEGVVASLSLSDGQVIWRKLLPTSVTRLNVLAASMSQDKDRAPVVVVSSASMLYTIDSLTGVLLWDLNTEEDVSICSGSKERLIKVGEDVFDTRTGKRVKSECTKRQGKETPHTVKVTQDELSLRVEARDSKNLLWYREELLAGLGPVVGIPRSDHTQHVSGGSLSTGARLVGWHKNKGYLVGVDLVRIELLWKSSIEGPVVALEVNGNQVIVKRAGLSDVRVETVSGGIIDSSDSSLEQYQWRVDHSGGQTVLNGYHGGNKTWNFVIPSSERSLVIEAQEGGSAQSEVLVKADASIVFKRDLAEAVLIVSEELSSEQTALKMRVIDTQSGSLLWTANIKNGTGPVKSKICDNWIIVHYFNVEKGRFELLVAEFYEKKSDPGIIAIFKQHILSKFKSIFGIAKQNIQQANDRPEAIVRQFVFLPGDVSVIGVTSTLQGVSPRSVLFALDNGKILALNKDSVLSARRPYPGQELEEGLPLYVPEISMDYLNVVSNQLEIQKVHSVTSVPTLLESTSIMIAAGLDIYAVPVRTPLLYDSLGSDFDMRLLLTSIAVVVCLLVVSERFASYREFQLKWK